MISTPNKWIIILRSLAVFVLISLTLSSTGIALAITKPLDLDATRSHPLAVMVIMDRIDIEDLSWCPNLQKLIDSSALALMNTSTAGRYDPESAYLTIGAGTRASAGGGGLLALSYYEEYDGFTAGEVFENFTGIKPDENNILVMDMPAIITENKKQDHDIVPGLLGELLKNSGIPVTYLGGADSWVKKKRLATTIAMDRRGVVNNGDVDSHLSIRDPQRPFFVKTDYDKLFNEFTHYKEQGGLLIVQPGDLIRAYDVASHTTNDLYHQYRSIALKEGDEFIGRLLAGLELEKDLFMLVVPFPSLDGYRNKSLLTPFVISGPGFSPGFALSATTRRPGLITNIDIAPTILSFFGTSIHGTILGHPIQGAFAPDTLRILTDANHRITSTYIHRAYIIKPFVAMLIVVSLGFLILVFLKQSWLRFIRPTIFASMAVPFALLILPSAASTDLISKYLWLIVITVLVVSISMIFKSTMRSIVFICLLVSFGIILDLFFGAPLMKSSMLGYDPIGGARYYGIGNEYMGVVIGALITGAMGFIEGNSSRHSGNIAARQRFAVVFLSLVLYLIASPRYGSNFGGALSAYGAFFVILLLLFKAKLDKKLVIPAFLGLTAVVAVIFYAMVAKGPPSHISQAFVSLRDQGIKPLLSIAGRKLSMNWKLFKYTPWTRALLTTIGVSIALFYYPLNILRDIFDKYPHLHRGFLGAGIGCLIALLVNDSGIVAAATMMIYIAMPLFLLVIDEFDLKAGTITDD